MKIIPGTIPTAAFSATGGGAEEIVPSERDRFSEFDTWMKRLDAMRESPEQRARRQAQEQKEVQQRRARQQKKNELESRIAQLRSKIANKTGDDSTAAELSMAKTQLFWLTNPL